MIWKLLRLPLIPFAMLCVLAMRLAYPKVKIRLGVMMSDRIGHQAGNIETYLCERDHGKHAGYFDIWIPWRRVANEQLLKMQARCIRIDRTRFLLLVVLCNKLFQGWERHALKTGTDRDPENLREKYPAHLSFTAREEAQGEEGLREMGIPLGAKFVCLMVRDSAFLPALTYHEYRDSNIEDYGPAALELAERGYWVIRMGSKVAKPFSVKHPRIIDYAWNGMRSDFMDIYLGAKCEFCVSSSTGWDNIPQIFRRPMCFVNFVPIEFLPSYTNSLAIWKHHYKDGKRLTLAEIYKSGIGTALFAQQYKTLEIEVRGNTPEEIKAVVLEMIEERTDEKMSAEQWAFWRDFPRGQDPFTGALLHGEIRMRIGREFLKQYVA